MLIDHPVFNHYCEFCYLLLSAYRVGVDYPSGKVYPLGCGCGKDLLPAGAGYPMGRFFYGCGYGIVILYPADMYLLPSPMCTVGTVYPCVVLHIWWTDMRSEANRRG